MKWINLSQAVNRIAAGMAACAALLAGSARADTNITGTTTVTDPNTWTASAGVVTLNTGCNLQFQPSAQGTYAIPNNLVLAGAAGTVSLGFKDNDTIFNLNGTITSNATGAQTLAIATGQSSNGDREEVSFNNPIPNATGGSTLGLQVTFNCQSASYSFVNLVAANTFTGPITLVKGSSVNYGYLTVGGRGIGNNGNQYAVTKGTGSLASGNYAGNITLGANTIFSYASSAAQTLSGVISGSGALQTVGTGPLTLSGVNTYTGTTTISSGGSLVLGSSGGLKFVVTDAAANKVTGAGSATINGAFTVDTSAVTVTSGSWTLVDATTKSFGGTFNLTGFTGSAPVFTKVSGGQTWTFTTTTGVLSLSSKAIITAFGISGSTGVINQTAKTIALTVPYTPWGKNGLAALAPTFTLTTGTCNQTSGSAPSPTFAASNPATYTVTDGAIINNYVVTVTITPASALCAMLTCDFGALGQAAINEAAGTASLTVPPSQLVTALAPNFTLSANATISPASGTTHDFTNPVTYRVTAENGTAYKDYAVSVQSYSTWAHSGSLFIVTTPSGANLASGVSVSNFPLLVRFNANNFNFADSQADGSDLRFASLAGAALPFQIEQWDVVNNLGAVWVLIPTITGNATQEIKMYWGKSGVASLSSGSSVFNATNGYASVIHMGDTLTDDTGATTPANASTTASNGLIGRCRTFAAGQGISCGTTLATLPTGNNPFSTEVWIRPTAANTTVLGWGIEQGSGKVVMQLASPPHMNMDCYFGGANVTGSATIPMSQWTHVVHTFQGGGSPKIYVNGVLDASATGGAMSIPTPARMYIGGWYGTYTYAGDMDEVRISSVARSADWVKLEYENQKPLQTLVGSIVPAGSTFSVSPPQVTMNENSSTLLTAQAGGAQKVYWVSVTGGVETVLAVDQLAFTYTVGRITGNQSTTLRFKAVYASGTQTIDIPVTIMDTIPDPVFTLSGPSTWDGRQTINITPVISNLASLPQGYSNLNYAWSVSGVAVAKTAVAGTSSTPGTLQLTRAQGSGPMTVTLTLDNGGALVSNSIAITVQEPASDAWLQRTPGATEKAVNNQFYARDPNTNKGTIFYNGTQSGSPNSVFLKIYTTDTGSDVLYASYSQALGTGGTYAFSAPIDAGKVTYKAVYGTTTGGTDTVVATVTNLVCGDAYILEGQSNALAIDSLPSDATNSNWIRTYGWTTATWGNAVRNGGDFLIGYWGYDLADYLQSTHNIPICIINGAVGGTRIDQHQANPAGHTVAGTSYSIYANLLNRVIGANLTYGIRGIFWHQGENNSGAAAPTGDWDYKSYQQYFVDMAAAWKQDYPNFQRYIIYQVMPAPCAMGPKGDQLRDVQRLLPNMFSKMHILDTLGISGYLGCHFTAAGYQGIADRTAPLVDQDYYGVVPGMAVTAPVLQGAYYTTSARTEIALQFDQNMSWNSFSTANYWLDKVGGKVTSGSVSGNIVKLQLASAGTAASTLDYLEDAHWAYTEATSSLLYGANGLPALSFADVPIALASPYYSWTSAQGLTAGVNDGPLADPEHDGICNLLEFALGGAPTTSSRAILPVSSQQAGNLVFEYDRSVASRPPNATQIVEYGSDLTGWTPVTIPYTSSNPVTITLGATTDHVKVVIPVAGTKVFARLRVITN